MRARFTRLAAFLLLAAPLAAQDKKTDDPSKDDDPIAVQLRKDKEAYIEALDKAKETLLKVFDKKYEDLKGNKSLKLEVQLKQLESLEAEKKAFEENDTLPGSLAMKAGVSEYRVAQKKAETVCKAAFEKAAKAYRDKGDVKAASATLEEMKEFLAKPTVTASGTIVIACRHSNKVLGIDRPAADEGSRVVTADYAKGDETVLWKSVPAGGGFVYFEHVKSGLVMTVEGNGKNNGADCILARKQQPPSDFQLWRLAPVVGQKDTVRIFSRGCTKLIGIDAKSTASGARIRIWTDQNESPQWFALMAPPK